ncbi:hypothetical protein Moror_1724 [Moniliophthora roreri MCA 2997]|uniref:Uncharacterized protein n=1 Tax=Moniliophthora roreri (strain MCA 2997) TaxID=1381753 RepID=V2X2U1_MONRO|nr:hypothetical protein Moror_1724 [Moniliophthora roreri MCA 2997]
MLEYGFPATNYRLLNEILSALPYASFKKLFPQYSLTGSLELDFPALAQEMLIIDSAPLNINSDFRRDCST